MTLQYHRIPTSHEVYRSIVNQHYKEDLGVYESFTNIVENGVSTIYTVWGLKKAAVALVGAETKYDSVDDKEVEGTRVHKYWLCAAYEGDE